MKRLMLISALIVAFMPLWAAIDMQAHQSSDEGEAAYSAYKNKQNAYYLGNYKYVALLKQDGENLFGLLNTLMGQTARIGNSNYSYNSLRDAYKSVDRDLNGSGNIIGYYDGCVLNGNWDSAKTWNREHTWPQSKGADSKTPMGHDMQSVRPASVKINSDRGNVAYGESGKYYDPDEVKINNPSYVRTNNGTYRGDCARVVLYDYIVYGQMGNKKNSLYNGEAQLLNKLGTSGVFESVEVILKWHMQDPPSLTEMVRNDGAQNYQGNRNPFIDYPELAIQVLKNSVKTYIVDANQPMKPNYQLTTKYGFVTYLTTPNGQHPQSVKVSGARSSYDSNTGRLTITDVTGDIQITTDTPYELEDPTDENQDDDNSDGLWDVEVDKINYYVSDDNLHILNAEGKLVGVYNMSGQCVYLQQSAVNDLQVNLQKGMYFVRIGTATEKIIVY